MFLSNARDLSEVQLMRPQAEDQLFHCLTSEFNVKFHAKNRYHTNREAIGAISVFQLKLNVEFTRQAVNFS